VPLVRGFAIVVLIASCRLNFDDVEPPRRIRATVIGQGAIVSEPPGLACIDQCEATFTGAVTLTVTPAGPSGVSAWSGAACSGETCVLEGIEDQDVTVELAALPMPGANRVFVTSTASNAALKRANDVDGLAAADRLCNQAAAAANLDGMFVAFLSSDLLGIDAIDRLGTASGWVRTDGAPVFTDKGAIGKLEQLVPIDRDEAGLKLTASSWLGGSHQGVRLTSPFNDCQGYAATPAESIYIFPPHAVGNDFVTSSAGCTFLSHLTCYQIDSQVPVVPPKPFPIGRQIFVSADVWPLGETKTADDQCQAEAERAGLRGEFVAALATKLRSVAEHANGLKGPWRRPDGAVIHLDALGDSIEAPLNRTAVGGIANSPVLIGASKLTEVATDNCDDWKDVSTPDRKTYGGWLFETEGWIKEAGVACGGRLLCLERGN
jgi:hypothetical protein